MTPFAQIVSGKKHLLNGPGWVTRHFLYNGMLVADRESSFIARRRLNYYT